MRNHRALRRETKLGRAIMALTRRYVANECAQGRAVGRHHAGLNCITVVLNDVARCYQEPGQGTVGSLKRSGPGAGRYGKRERRGTEFHVGLVVRAYRPIQG